jgi:hypothetical protein
MIYLDNLPKSGPYPIAHNFLLALRIISAQARRINGIHHCEKLSSNLAKPKKKIQTQVLPIFGINSLCSIVRDRIST